MDNSISDPTAVAAAPASSQTVSSASPVTPTPEPDQPWLARFRAHSRLTWPLRRSGHYPRRLLAQVIDHLVILAIAVVLFAGTDYAPIQRREGLTIIVFPEFPVLRRIVLTHQHLDRAAGRETAPAGEATPAGAEVILAGTNAALDSAITPPAPAGFTFLRHRTVDGTEYAYTWHPNPGWYLYLVLFVAYHTLLVGWRSQTVGKWLMRLRVVGKGGNRVGYLRALVRPLAYLPGAYLYLGIFWILVDRQRRGWHDLVAGTRIAED